MSARRPVACIVGGSERQLGDLLADGRISEDDADHVLTDDDLERRLAVLLDDELGPFLFVHDEANRTATIAVYRDELARRRGEPPPGEGTLGP